MLPVKNTFIKGMNQDLSPDKMPELNYFYLLNGNIITHSGLTTGAVSNEKGNTLAFSIPDTAPVYVISIPNGYTGPDTITFTGSAYSTSGSVTATDRDALFTELSALCATDIANGYYTIQKYGPDIIVVGLDDYVGTSAFLLQCTLQVDSQSDNKIVGLGTLDNYLIAITTNSTAEPDNTSAGQIWVFEYTESTGTIKDINGFSLVPSKHLKYNNILNLSTKYRVGEIVGRAENSKTARIYFTDNNNSLRAFNILSSTTFGLLPYELDIVAPVAMSQPLVSAIGSGSIPTPSVVQFAYRLTSLGGSVTTYSPVSHLVPLTPFDPLTEDYADYIGGSSTGARSVTYELTDLDTTFDLIEHVVIRYEQANMPIIEKFAEEYIPQSGAITVTYSGNEDVVAISPQEFNALSYGFDKCKTITEKRNRLIAANTTTSTFNPTFDARAYRFNSIGNSNILDSAGSTTTFDNTSYPTDETLDAIGPFSLPEDDANYDSTFKYKSDGITLGGEGPNISYEFITENYQANESYLKVAQPYVTVSRYSTGTIMNVGNGKTYDASGYFKDYKSPLKSAFLRGYMPGEVYRFGIVFLDKKGNPSFVKWIGDIRFPEAFDSGFEPLSTSGEQVFCKTIGIRFAVDVSSIEDDITGFYITRVERKEADKTRLGSGLHLALTDGTSSMTSRYDDYSSLGTDTTATIGGSSHTNVAAINDIKTYQLASDTTHESSVQDLLFFVSPLVQFPKNVTGYEFRQGDYLKEIGYSIHDNSRYFTNSDEFADIDFCKGWALPINKRNFDIESRLSMEFGAWDLSSIGGGNYIINASVSKETGANKWIPFGIGNKKELMRLKGTGSGIITSHSGNEFDYPAERITTVDSAFYYKNYAYCRIVANQYNGNSFESRANQAYLPCTFVKTDGSGSYTIDPWSGDTFTLLYSDEVISPYFGNAADVGVDYEDSVTYKMGPTLFFPVYSSINTKLRQGQFWEQDKDIANMGNWVQSYYEMDAVYNQESIAKLQFYTKDFIDNTTEEQPHRIWASERKLDGELYDSWRVFKPNNFREVDGIYGPVNKVITHRDKLFFYQDRAFGVASVEDRSIVNDEAGVEIVLGNGGVLDYHAYISTRTGTKHQFSVTESGSSLYHADALNRKIFRYTEGMGAKRYTEGMGAKPLSDVNGLYAYMLQNIKGATIDTDQTLNYLSQNGAVGIHSVFDARNNRVIFTVLGGYYETRGMQEFWIDESFTVAYNEMMDAFESFYSFRPRMYLNSGIRLLSVNPSNFSEAYIHNEGTRGEYYEVNNSLELTIIVNAKTDALKTLDVLDLLMELKTSLGVDIPTETISSLRVYNSYQDTGTITLVPNTNIIRKLRRWRVNVLRDQDTDKPRLRDHYFVVEVKFTNNLNKQILLHDLTSHVRPS